MSELERTTHELEAAMQAWLDARGLFPDGAMVSDWIVLGASISLDGTEQQTTGYFYLTSRESMPAHVTAGLVTVVGGGLVRDVMDDGWVEDEDDE